MPSFPFHESGPGLDHAAARELLAPCLPDAGGVPVVPFGEGDFCLAFRQGSRVVRVARHAEAAAALRREACVLGGIADRLPLPVPRPTHHVARGCPPFSVHEEVRGAVLTRERWLGLSPDARERTAGELAAFLDALHRLPVETARSCGLPRIDAAGFARDLRAGALATLHPLLDAETRDRLGGTLARAAGPPGGGEPRDALLHRDVAPGHVLFDPAAGRLTGIIDFGDLAVGDPARDFVYVHEDFGPEMLAAVLRHYRGEAARTLLPRIHLWYLLEAVAWTAEAYEGGETDDARHGVGEIVRELATLAALEDG